MVASQTMSEWSMDPETTRPSGRTATHLTCARAREMIGRSGTANDEPRLGSARRQRGRTPVTRKVRVSNERAEAAAIDRVRDDERIVPGPGDDTAVRQGCDAPHLRAREGR